MISIICTITLDRRMNSKRGRHLSLVTSQLFFAIGHLSFVISYGSVTFYESLR
jgi:hypothetical protein